MLGAVRLCDDGALLALALQRHALGSAALPAGVVAIQNLTPHLPATDRGGANVAPVLNNCHNSALAEANTSCPPIHILLALQLLALHHHLLFPFYFNHSFGQGTAGQQQRAVDSARLCLAVVVAALRGNS